MLPSSHGLRLRTRAGNPDFLDLPWDRPLETWQGGRLMEVARGVHRHVVRFVAYGDRLYALKELPPRVCAREYDMLRRMALEGLPVVESVGIVQRAGMPSPDGPLEDVLITRFLDYSLPYRTLFAHRRSSEEPFEELDTIYDRLLDALAILLVRMHLLGFYWGDCSLSNTLFRRDAGALAAYIVDLETGEYHPTLSDGQRRTDLEITETNVAGGLLDLEAEFGLVTGPDPIETAQRLGQRYDLLWRELTTEELIGPDERYKIDARLRRLNALGFAVDEVELVSSGEGNLLALRTSVTEQGHHRRRLLELTGLQAQENQARSLLNDLANFRAAVESTLGRTLPESVAAHRWLTEVFEPIVEAVPEQLSGKLEPVELFHEVIIHKWFISERHGRDVGVDEAVRSYLTEVLPSAPDERTILASEDDAAVDWIGFG